MKVFGFSMLFLILFFISFAFIGEGTASSSSGLALEKKHRGYTSLTVKNRKLKGRGFTASAENDKPGTVNLEDYRPIDPVPSSKAIRPGPIQHGTPLMPYIPKPSPPPIRSKDGLLP